jgi:nucleotide-binding universal stress UspA family protein
LGEALKKLLVLLSGAGSLSKAANFTLDFARKEQSTDIVLLYVVDNEVPASVSSWLIYVGFMGDKPSDDYKHTILKEFRQRAQEDLDEARDLIAKGGFHCRTRLEEGSLLETIIRMAEDEKADLVALALPGKSEVGGILYHEAAKNLRKKSTCAVKII